MEVKISVSKYNEVYSGEIQRLLDLGARIIKNGDVANVGMILGNFKKKNGGNIVIKSTYDICINNVILPLCKADKEYCNKTITIQIEDETLTEEREIEILMMDRGTKAEAEKHLKNGSTIFTDFEEHFDDYMKEWNIEEDEIPTYKKMIEEKIPAPDWGIVEDEGKTYYIMYVL